MRKFAGVRASWAGSLPEAPINSSIDLKPELHDYKPNTLRSATPAQ